MSGIGPHTPARRGTSPAAALLHSVDHEQRRRDVQCGMCPDEIAVDREDELQDRRDRFDDMGPSRWAA